MSRYSDKTLVAMLSAPSGQSPIDAETMKRAAKHIEVLDGVIDLAYVPHRSLVEDNDRLRKQRDALTAELAAANDYALRLVKSLAQRFPAVEGFQPMPDLYGKLSQIDNMTCKLPHEFGAETPVKHEPKIRHHDMECHCSCGGPWPCPETEVQPSRLPHLGDAPNTKCCPECGCLLSIGCDPDCKRTKR